MLCGHFIGIEKLERLKLLQNDPLVNEFDISVKEPETVSRFLALKSILLIIIGTPFYGFCYYYCSMYRLIKADNSTQFRAFFFHPMGESCNLKERIFIKALRVVFKVLT